MSVINSLYSLRDEARALKDKDLLSITVFLIGELERLDKAKRSEQAMLAILRKTKEAETTIIEYRPASSAFNIGVIDSLLKLGPQPATQKQLLDLVNSAKSLKDLMVLALKAEKDHNIIIDKKLLKSMWEAE